MYGHEHHDLEGVNQHVMSVSRTAVAVALLESVTTFAAPGVSSCVCEQPENGRLPLEQSRQQVLLV